MTTEDEKRLREALEEDAVLLHHYVHPDASFEECDGARCIRRREQLAAAPAPAGLDVDVLAEAFYNVTRGRMKLVVLPPWRDPSITADVWEKAVADGYEVAAEYVRLAESREGEEG